MKIIKPLSSSSKGKKEKSITIDPATSRRMTAFSGGLLDVFFIARALQCCHPARSRSIHETHQAVVVFK
jgi:hypothetical protein